MLVLGDGRMKEPEKSLNYSELLELFRKNFGNLVCKVYVIKFAEVFSNKIIFSIKDKNCIDEGLDSYYCFIKTNNKWKLMPYIVSKNKLEFQEFLRNSSCITTTELT